LEPKLRFIQQVDGLMHRCFYLVPWALPGCAHLSVMSVEKEINRLRDIDSLEY